MSAWPTVPLRDIASVGAGNSAPQDPKLFEGGILPFIRTSDVGQIRFGQIDRAEDLLNKEGARGLRVWPAGTILFPKSGASTFLNHRVMTEVDACVASHLATIVVDRALVLPKFLLYYLHTVRAQDLTQDHNYPSLRLPEIGAIQVPLPSLAGQKRIVAILDDAFEGIGRALANAERNLENVRELFDAGLSRHFSGNSRGFVMRPIGDVCNLLGGFAFRSTDAIGESNTQLVRMGNVYNNVLDLGRSPVFYPDSFVSEYQRYVLKTGDLIMSLTGTTGKEDYGYAVRIPDCTHALLLNQRLVKFEIIEGQSLRSDYLFYYLRSRCFLDLLYATANGTRQANLSTVAIKTLPIPLPSMAEQLAISEAAESLVVSCGQLESGYFNRIKSLGELKTSLLHKAFSAQLTGTEAIAA